VFDLIDVSREDDQTFTSPEPIGTAGLGISDKSIGDSSQPNYPKASLALFESDFGQAVIVED
jgi:hypothetical protein